MWDNIKQLNRHETGTAGGKERENEEEKGFEKKSWRISLNSWETKALHIQETHRLSNWINATHPHTHTHLGTFYSNDWRKHGHENILKAARGKKRYADRNRQKNYCRLIIKTHANLKIME